MFRNPWTSLVLLMVVVATRPCDGGMTFHVSPAGKDDNPGTRQAPLATLAGARDKIRSARKAGTLPAGPVVVELTGGTYRLAETLKLSAADSGTKDAPVIWQAAAGQEVRLIGGVRLRGFRPVSDAKVLARLAPRARNHVRQCDLGAAGVADFGRAAGGTGRRAELYCNHKYMTLAHYPNDGWLRIAGIPPGAATKRPVSNPKRPDLNRYEGPFRYDDGRPAHWAEAGDIWVHGYWFHDWSDQYHQVQRLDTKRRELWPKPPYHSYGYKKGQRFRFLNVLEELDSPGEWYLDRQTGMLYFWPPGPTDKAEIAFPVLAGPMVVLDGVRHVELRRLVLECSRGPGVVVRGGADCGILGCTVRNVGGPGIDIQGGLRHAVRSCDVHHLAGIGISLQGGERTSLARGDHVVDNCHVHHFAQVAKTYRPGIRLAGVGQRVAHCFLHDCPHAGIGYAGNDHVIEYCEFTRIARETGDVGVIYAAMDWTYAGHVFRHNYFHNVHAPGRLGCFTVYPDLPCGGIRLVGNVFYDLDAAFHTNSGRGMVIENNIFLRCGNTIRFNVWRDMKKFRKGGNWRMVERLHDVHYDRPPYSTRYPMLARLAEDFARGDEHVLQRAIPKDNFIRRNVSWGDGRFLTLGAKAGLQHVRVQDNVIADPVVFLGSPDGKSPSRQYRNGDEDIAALLAKSGNTIVSGDPGFGDLRTQDFALAPSSPAGRTGFRAIPFDKIGLVRDEYRTAVPLRANAPVIHPSARRFLGELTVRIIPTPVPGQAPCVIRYTTDGADPTAQSARYDKPLHVSTTVTLKAAAFASDGDEIVRSPTVSATFTALRLGEGGIYLSDLPERDLVAYMSCWKKDTNHLGGPIRIGGKAFARGILLHPAETKAGRLGRVTYELTGPLREAKRFTAMVGIDDTMHKYEKGSAGFAVDVHRQGKWQRVWQSGVRKLGQPPLAASVDIAGADRIRLIATDGGDGIQCDHAVWADAKLR